MANHHVVVAQHNGTDLRWIMHHVPKILRHVPRIIYSGDIQRMIFMLGHAQQNQPTFGIGEGAVRLP